MIGTSNHWVVGIALVSRRVIVLGSDINHSDCFGKHFWVDVFLRCIVWWDMLDLWRVVHQQKNHIIQSNWWTYFTLFSLVKPLPQVLSWLNWIELSTANKKWMRDTDRCKKHKDSCTSRLRRLLRYDLIHHQNAYVEHSDSTYKCISMYNTVVYTCIYTYLNADTYTSVRYVTLFPRFRSFHPKKPLWPVNLTTPHNETRV